MNHSSNVIKGSHEQNLKTKWNQETYNQVKLTDSIRKSNNTIHDGKEGLALIRRENTNSTLQPLYPISIVNDSFKRHTQARAIDKRNEPKPENARHVHLTQKMYLPYERTRKDFPITDINMNAPARDSGPSWWPGKTD